MGVLTKSDIVKVKEIDRNVKKKFSFAWLERTVEIANGLKVSLGDDIAKTDNARQAVCKLCNKHINYGSRGAIALDDHVKSAKHTGLVKQRQSSHKIKDLFDQQKEGAYLTSGNASICIAEKMSKSRNARITNWTMI